MKSQLTLIYIMLSFHAYITKTNAGTITIPDGEHMKASTDVDTPDHQKNSRCKLKRTVFNIYEPGCDVTTVESYQCQGYCKSKSWFMSSFSGTLLREKCRCCKVKKFRLQKIKIKCPLHDEKIKTIEYRAAVGCACKKCKKS